MFPRAHAQCAPNRGDPGSNGALRAACGAAAPLPAGAAPAALPRRLLPRADGRGRSPGPLPLPLGERRTEPARRGAGAAAPVRSASRGTRRVFRENARSSPLARQQLRPPGPRLGPRFQGSRRPRRPPPPPREAPVSFGPPVAGSRASRPRRRRALRQRREASCRLSAGAGGRGSSRAAGGGPGAGPGQAGAAPPPPPGGPGTLHDSRLPPRGRAPAARDPACLIAPAHPPPPGPAGPGLCMARRAGSPEHGCRARRSPTARPPASAARTVSHWGGNPGTCMAHTTGSPRRGVSYTESRAPLHTMAAAPTFFPSEELD